MTKPKAKVDTRHAKPKPGQLAERRYRNELKHYATLMARLDGLTEQIAGIDVGIGEVVAQMAKEHRELRSRCDQQDKLYDRLAASTKELVRQQSVRLQIAQAHSYMAAPLPRGHAPWPIDGCGSFPIAGRKIADPEPLQRVPTLEPV